MVSYHDAIVCSDLRISPTTTPVFWVYPEWIPFLCRHVHLQRCDARFPT